MPARFHHVDGKAPVVLTMPSPSNCTQQHASVVEMPARTLPSRIDEPDEPAETHARAGSVKRANHLGFSDGLRMTLVALFALLGWPRPTHGKDPGAAAARPFKLELLNVISRLYVPAPAIAGRMAAQAGLLDFPQPPAEEMDIDLASAA